MQLPRVLIRVKLDEGWIKLVCLIVPEIGYKAHIETPRFERLVKSFNLLPEQLIRVQVLLNFFLASQSNITAPTGSVPFSHQIIPRWGYTLVLFFTGEHICLWVLYKITPPHFPHRPFLLNVLESSLLMLSAACTSFQKLKKQYR